MELTYNNHLTYTINNRTFGFRETPYEKYRLSVGKVDMNYFSKNTWLSEQHRIGSLVTDNIGKDFILLYSGLNSECILRILLSLNVKPKLIFIRFAGDHNIAEYYHAVKSATDLGMELSVFDYDIMENYCSGKLIEFADSVQISNVIQAVLFHCIHKLQSPVVLGFETIFRKIISLDKINWCYYFPETIGASHMRYSIKYNIPVISQWFSYTPEAIAYWLVNVELDSDIYKHKVSTNSIQNKIFSELMPNLNMVLHKNGYENLLGLTTEFSLRGMMHEGLENIDGILLDDLRKQLYGEEYVSSQVI
jgi:hypothetical protein